MNIWLLNPYGPLPSETWREYRFAMVLKALADRGHQVIWWTAAFDHFTKTRRSTSWTTIPVDDNSSIRLVPTPKYDRNIGVGRIAFEMAFAHRVYRKGRTEQRPDVILAADPPQTNGAAAVLLARHFRVPLILDCLDLWPELFAGALPRPLHPLLLPLRALRRWTYSQVSFAIASCDTYRRHLLEEVSSLRADKAETVFIGVSREDVNDPAPRGAEFTAIYAGTLGHNYDLPTVLDAARLLASNGRVRFVIAGEGPLRDYIVERIRSENIANVDYIGRISPADLRKWYSIAHVGLLPYAEWSTVAMPVKLYDYLAAGLPLVSSLAGESQDVMRRCGAGVSYRAGDARSLAEALESLARNEAQRDTMAENARRCAAQFDRDEQYRRYADIVERVARHDSAHDKR